jgi:hypothetical protein
VLGLVFIAVMAFSAFAAARPVLIRLGSLLRPTGRADTRLRLSWILWSIEPNGLKAIEISERRCPMLFPSQFATTRLVALFLSALKGLQKAFGS